MEGRVTSREAAPLAIEGAFVRITIPACRNRTGGPHAANALRTDRAPRAPALPCGDRLAGDLGQRGLTRTWAFRDEPPCSTALPDGEHPSFGDRTSSSSRRASSRCGWSRRG